MNTQRKIQFTSRYITFSIIIALLWAMPFSGESADLAVVANPDVTISSISISDLRRIFMGKKRLWSNKKAIKAYYLTDKIAVGKDLIEKVTHISSHSYKKYWVKKIFSGFGSPPTPEQSYNILIEHVIETPGAIAIIDREVAKVLTGCKQITIVQ